jgi:hypothetical protein
MADSTDGDQIAFVVPLTIVSNMVDLACSVSKANLAQASITDEDLLSDSSPFGGGEKFLIGVTSFFTVL